MQRRVFLVSFERELVELICWLRTWLREGGGRVGGKGGGTDGGELFERDELEEWEEDDELVFDLVESLVALNWLKIELGIAWVWLLVRVETKLR